jgi:hypothetical protein
MDRGMMIIRLSDAHRILARMHELDRYDNVAACSGTAVCSAHPAARAVEDQLGVPNGDAIVLATALLGPTRARRASSRWNNSPLCQAQSNTNDLLLGVPTPVPVAILDSMPDAPYALSVCLRTGRVVFREIGNDLGIVIRSNGRHVAKLMYDGTVCYAVIRDPP